MKRARIVNFGIIIIVEYMKYNLILQMKKVIYTEVPFVKNVFEIKVRFCTYIWISHM